MRKKVLPPSFNCCRSGTGNVRAAQIPNDKKKGTEAVHVIFKHLTITLSIIVCHRMH